MGYSILVMRLIFEPVSNPSESCRHLACLPSVQCGSGSRLFWNSRIRAWGTLCNRHKLRPCRSCTYRTPLSRLRGRHTPSSFAHHRPPPRCLPRCTAGSALAGRCSANQTRLHMARKFPLCGQPCSCTVLHTRNTGQVGIPSWYLASCSSLPFS